MRNLSWIVLSLLLAGSAVPARAAETVPWGPNLFPNGSMEQVDAAGVPTGWKLEPDPARAYTLTTSPEACAGARCLFMSLNPGANPDTHVQVESPVVATPEPGWYLLNFWFRFDFTDARKPYPLFACDRYAQPDGTQRLPGFSPNLFRASDMRSGQWYYTYLIFRQRPGQGAVGVRFDGAHNGQSLRLDAFQLRRLTVPEQLPATDYNRITDGVWGATTVPDAASPGGRASEYQEGRNTESGIMTGVRQSEVPGLYVGVYDFEQVARGGEGDWGLQMDLASGSGDGTGQTLDPIAPSDFRAAGDWEQFSAPFLYAFSGGSYYSFSWSKLGTYRFRGLSLKYMMPVTYRQSWSLFYDGVDADRVVPRGAPLATPVWLAAGLHSDLYGLDQALAALSLPATRSDYVSGKGLLPTMPDLSAARLVVLAGAPARALSPVQQYLLERFVEQGGGLVILGGLTGYGYGGMKGSFLEEMAPVALTSGFDLARVPEPGTVTLANGQTLGQCAWAHQVTVKAGGTVAARSGKVPLIVTGTYGKGRVVAVVATALGTPTDPFWAKPAWVMQLANQMRWAAKK
ncbi:MAG TPA: hypothetical protein VGM19_09765 [Armatimonadota bacterium]|jgi:hypothetical protein